MRKETQVPGSMSEEELIRLVDTYSGTLFGLCRMTLGDTAMAQDIVQVIALAWRAGTQIAATGAQRNAAAIVVQRRQFRHWLPACLAVAVGGGLRMLLDRGRGGGSGVGAQFDQTELDIVDGQIAVPGAAMEQGHSGGRFLRLVAFGDQAVAVAADGDIVGLGDLLQVFVQRTAEIGQLRVVSIQMENDW